MDQRPRLVEVVRELGVDALHILGLHLAAADRIRQRRIVGDLAGALEPVVDRVLVVVRDADMGGVHQRCSSDAGGSSVACPSTAALSAAAASGSSMAGAGSSGSATAGGSGSATGSGCFSSTYSKNGKSARNIARKIAALYSPGSLPA